MGHNMRASGLLRFSFDHLNSPDQANFAANTIEKILTQLREIKNHEDELSEYDKAFAVTKKKKNVIIRLNKESNYRYQDKDIKNNNNITTNNTTTTTTVTNNTNITHSNTNNSTSNANNSTNNTNANSTNNKNSNILVIKKNAKFNSKEYKRIYIPLGMIIIFVDILESTNLSNLSYLPRYS
jgi:hypothetical protein